tara:strand:+ start:71 stop:277 length:207 start_codon:yes stop_codon:yes gene_type:complete
MEKLYHEHKDHRTYLVSKALEDNLKSWEELKEIDLEIMALHRRYKDLMARVQSSIGVFHQLHNSEEER